MLLRITTSVAGPGFDLHPGDETDRFCGDEAVRLIAAEYAVPVTTQNIERAIAVDPAIERRRGRHRR